MSTQRVLDGVATVTGSAAGRDASGVPNAPAGHEWDLGMLARGHFVSVPTSAEPPARQPVAPPPAVEAPPPLTPEQSDAVDSLTCALMQVAASGLGERAMELALERRALAQERVLSLDRVERAFLAMAVINGDAQE